jgi:hypothetical protein
VSETPPDEPAEPSAPEEALAEAAPGADEGEYEAPPATDTGDEADRPTAELGGLAAALLSRPSEAIRVAELRERLAREEAAPAPVTPVTPPAPTPVAPPTVEPAPPPPPPRRPRSARRRALEGVLLATAALGPAAAGLTLVLLGAPQRALAFLRTNDALEPNDRISDAPLVASGAEVEGLRLDPTDVDWFAVDVPAGKALTVCSGVTPRGRAETSIHRADGVVVASSRGTPQGGLERAVWWPGAGAAAERVYARVIGAREAFTFAPAAVDPSTRFEPNDGATQASVVQAGRRLEAIQGSGEDWFRVVVPPQRALRVRLLNSSPNVSLAWARTASPTTTGPGAPMAAPPPTASVAAICTEVTAPAVGAGRALLLRVTGAGRYDLALDLESPTKVTSGRAGRRSPARVVEGARLEPNDVRSQAPPVRAGRYPDIRGNGDDWFVVDVPADAILTTTLAFSHRSGDIDLQLQHQDGRPIEASSGTDDSETASARLPEGGLVYIHVVGGSNPYTMTIDLERGQAADELGPGRYLDLQGSGNDLWLVRLDAGDLLDATASWDPNLGHLDLQVLDQGWNQVGANLDQQWRSQTEQVVRARFATPGPRVVFLRLAGTQMPYTLDLDVGPASAVSVPAGMPGVVRPIQPGVHRGLQVSGEALWTIDVAQGQRLGVELQFKSATSDIDLELLDAAGDTIARSGSGGDKEAVNFISESDQTLRIKAYTYGPASRCTMTVTLEDGGGAATLEPGDHPAQTCAGRATYRVLVPAGKKLVASIAFASADGDLDLDLRDANGALIVRSETTEDREVVEHTATEAETVSLVVWNATNVFDLTVALEDP